MVDIVDKQTRSRMMAGISGKNTKPELQIRKALHALGYRYKLHASNLPGRPDVVLPKYRTAILINGCFWHGHDCHLFKMPGTRTEFWSAKINGNIARDKLVRKSLLAASWRVLTIWECALKGKTRIGLEEVTDRVTSWLPSKSDCLEIRGEANAIG